MEILTLLKANIKHKRGAFKSLIILMIIITLSIAAVISVNDNQQKNLEESLEKANVGDVAVYISENKLTDEMLAPIENDINTNSIDIVNGLALCACEVNGQLSSNMMVAMPLELENHEYSLISENLLSYEKEIDALKKGEIYLPLGMKALYSCEIGDKLTLTYNVNQEIETFIIKGFVEEPFVGAYFIGVKNVFISDEDFTRLTNLTSDVEVTVESTIFPYNIVNIYQAEDSNLSISEYQKLLNDKSSLITTSLTLSKEQSMEYTLMFTQIFSKILLAFIILLFVIVIIVMGHSITTGIEIDYVNLGILKSQGFSKGKIQLVFILQYFFAELIGAIIGILIAIPITKILGSTFQNITGILSSANISFGILSLILIGIVLISICFIFIKTIKIGKISPIRAISGGREAIYFDSRIKIPINKKSLNLKMSLRQLTSNKRQYIGIVLITAILTYFMMSMGVLASFISSDNIFESVGGFKEDISIYLKEDFEINDIDEIENEINKISEIKVSRFSKSTYALIDSLSYNCSCYDKPETITGMLKGRQPLYDNEIVITEILAEEIGKNIGDTVTLSYRDGTEEYMISGFYQYTNDLGKCFSTSLAAIQKLDDEFKPASAQIKFKNADKCQEVVDMLNNQFSDILEAEVFDTANLQQMNLITMAVNAITFLIYAISIIFVVVVVNMVCGKLFIKEKHDIAIYKSIGFTSKNLRVQFAFRFLIVSIIGSILGLTLCFIFNNKMMNALLRGIGISNFKTEYTLFVALAPVILICTCFFVISFLSTKKIKTVEIRELISDI